MALEHHCPVTNSEVLLTALPDGWVTPVAKCHWVLKVVYGSGREVLKTPTSFSTRLANMIPNGSYIVQCTLDNGEGRKRVASISVLVDAVLS